MHRSVMVWVNDVLPNLPVLGANVLELGSLDVNGTVRPLFADARQYTGIDMQVGPGVDVRAVAARLPFPDASFDIVVSTEMLEHDLTFWLSLQEALRVLRPRGYLLITCRGFGFPYHEFPGDYYRFTPEGLGCLLLEYGVRTLRAVDDPQAPGVFCYARK